jgi:hypothetical protein
MGENMQSKVAKAFEIFSNKAYGQRLLTPDLFSRVPFVYNHAFRCRASNGTALNAGSLVMILPRKKVLEVWMESHIVGEIDDDDAEEVFGIFKDKTHEQRWLPAHIEEVVGIDGRFSVLIEGGPFVIEAVQSR